MRRERSPLRCGHLLLAFLLCLPPGLRLGLHFWKRPSAGDGASAPERPDTGEAALDELRRIEGARRLPTLDDPEGRYHLVPADVLPVNDPSGRRSALWVVARGSQNVPVDTAAVWHDETSPHGELAGRATRELSPTRLARVQTILDPGFRVRFRHEGASGMLFGTGREHEGHPILELKYVVNGDQLDEGEPVFTEGGDGVYPPSVLIGHLRRAADCGGRPEEERLVVRASRRIAGLRRLALSVDSRRVELEG